MNKNIKTWEERAVEHASTGEFVGFPQDHMKPEIAELRAYIAELEARPAATESISTGYEGGTCISDPTGLGATINLHYASPGEAEHAFEVITDCIGTKRTPTVAGSVDTPEFRELLANYSLEKQRPAATNESIAKARADFITYINARLAPAAPSVTPAAPVVAGGIVRGLSWDIPTGMRVYGTTAEERAFISGFKNCQNKVCEALAAHPVAGSTQDDAARWQYIKATTTAIRNHETGEREECTPEQFEASVDRLRGANPVAGSPAACVECKGTGMADSYMLCEDVDAYVEEAREALTASVRCDECAGTGKCGPDEDPNEMDCEVCNGSGQVAAHPVAGSPAEAEPDALDRMVSDMSAEDRAEVEKIRAELRAMPIEEVAKMVRGTFVNVGAAEPMPASEAPTDAEIIAACHSVGVDTDPSIYGFPELQVKTNVPGIRNIINALRRTAPVPTSEAQKLPMIEVFARLLEIQRNEAASGDPYMVGLYNGIVMMCSNLDGIAYELIQLAAPVPASEAASVPIPVWELYADGWDGVDDLDGDWMQTLPIGTKLYYLAAPAAPVPASEAWQGSLQAGS